MLDSGGRAWNNEAVRKKQRDSTYFYIFTSLLLIVTAVGASAVLTRIKDAGSSQDVRARASVTSLMRLTAVITAVDSKTRVVTVNALQFTSSLDREAESFARNTAGEWSVRATGDIDLTTLSSGMKVELQVNPASFSIADRSFAAAVIKPLR